MWCTICLLCTPPGLLGYMRYVCKFSIPNRAFTCELSTQMLSFLQIERAAMMHNVFSFIYMFICLLTLQCHRSSPRNACFFPLTNMSSFALLFILCHRTFQIIFTLALLFYSVFEKSLQGQQLHRYFRYHAFYFIISLLSPIYVSIKKFSAQQLVQKEDN